MLRYKTIKVTIPANGEAEGTILTVPNQEKVTLKGLGNDQNVTSVIFMEIEGNKFIQAYYDIDAGYGKFIPLNQEVSGPQDIKVGATDLSGSGGDIYFTLMYEE